MSHYKTINYHFTRVCNFTCEFCFFTQKNSNKLSLEESLLGIRKLKDFGIEKINFAGGEPFIYPKQLGEMIKYSKEIGLATSVITNGSLVTEEWFNEYGEYLDMLGVSCDSLNEMTNFKIGRFQKGKDNSTQVENIRKCFAFAKKFNCITKINTVVCKYNFEEDMNSIIEELKPDRWKVFQVLYVPNENGDLNLESKKRRNALELVISENEFTSFLKRHEQQPSLIFEKSEVMENGYLMVDENMCFIYSDDEKEKVTSLSLLNHSVEELISEVNYSKSHFMERKGEFDWFKNSEKDSLASQ